MDSEDELGSTRGFGLALICAGVGVFWLLVGIGIGWLIWH